MSPSSFGAPEEAGGQPEPSPPREPVGVDRAMLDRVLQETRATLGKASDLDPAEFNALQEVARHHAGSELSQPIVAELVQAVLTTHFQNLQWGKELRESVAHEIAIALWNDPPAQERLLLFWQRLGEASA